MDQDLRSSHSQAQTHDQLSDTNLVKASGQPAVTVQLGKERMIFTPLLLGLITFGIYQLVWLYKIHDEMLNHTGNRNIKPGLAIGLLFVPILNVFWAIYLLFSVPGLIKEMEMQCGIPMSEQTSAGLIGVLGIIPIIGALAWPAMVQSALNRHWQHHSS